MKQLYEIDCDPECGFMVRSHEKNEVIKMGIEHMKNIHSKDVSEEEASSMVKMV